MGRRKNKTVSPDRILEELAAIGFARATDYLQVEGNVLSVKDTAKLRGSDGAAVAAIERTSNGLKVKLYDKLKALELMGKHMGMFSGDVPSGQQGENNLLELLLKASGEEVETGDIPELQQAADSGDDVVEPTGS